MGADGVGELLGNLVNSLAGFRDRKPAPGLWCLQRRVDPGADGINTALADDVVEVAPVVLSHLVRCGDADGMPGPLPSPDCKPQRFVRRAVVRVIVPTGDDGSSCRQRQLGQAAECYPGFVSGC